MSDNSRAILVVSVELAEEDADELNRWYREEHGPEKLSLPGYLGLRRFRAHDGSAKFLAIYELSEPGAAFASGTASPESVAHMEAIMEKWHRWERSVWIEL